MLKATADTASFLSRSGSFSTHGKRNGHVAMAPTLTEKQLIEEKIIERPPLLNKKEELKVKRFLKHARMKANRDGKEKKRITPHSLKLEDIWEKRKEILARGDSPL